MQHIFDRLISACREIISQEQQLQQLASDETTDGVKQAQKETVFETEQWGEDKWHQLQKAITRHIQIENANKTGPVILLEEQSEEQNKPNDPQETQGECDSGKIEDKSALKSLAEVKPSFIFKKKVAPLAKKVVTNRKQEMNRQVRCKVNIQELKQKIIHNKPKDPKLPIKPPIPQIKQTQPLSSIIARDTLKAIEEINPDESEENRGKVAKKGGKNQRPASMGMAQRPAQMDLGGKSLQQVVEECRARGVIGDELYMQFIASSSEESIAQFIALFIQNNLRLWDFRKFKITIMDHRRLAQYLVRIYPQRYKICDPRSEDPNVRDFLENLYGLTPLKYKKLLESLDAESKVAEWKALRSKFQKYANVPVRIQPLPIPIMPQEKLAIKRPIGQVYGQTAKTAPMVRGVDKEKKRGLSSLYEGNEEQEMRLNALKSQLRKSRG